MGLEFLEFERPIAELKAKIDALRTSVVDPAVNLQDEILRLESKREGLTRSIFKSLTDWQVVQLARHPLRPHASDYIERIFSDFDEFHGDRLYRDDGAIIGGTARFYEMPVMIIAQQKGRSTKEKLSRNFGMASPEGYRKAQRLMVMAEKFRMPILTFIDTAGAYPGIDAEEHGQSEAIARNLALMSQLKVPIISTVIGEGGSGGALAIGVGDRLIMLQYSIYSVITPEGCASILWKNAEKAQEAAQAMHVTAARLHQLKLLDEVIEEPLGGAHRDPDEMAYRLKNVLHRHWVELQPISAVALVEARYQRLLSFGRG
jgi:acetyl-CoA carboxylase carboxyl transferase subunit alpha